MTSPRLTLTISIVTTIAISACSIASGWSDLQREPPPGNSSGTSGSNTSSGTSGGTSGGGTSGDGTSGGTSGGGTSGGTSGGGGPRISCGLEVCDPDEACCNVGGGASQVCVTERIACTSNGVYIECQAPQDCAGRPDKKNVCCWDLGLVDGSAQRSATCAVACTGNGRYPVCNRDTLTGCTGSDECMKAAGSPSDSPIFACR
jgi:hypothetical protein